MSTQNASRLEPLQRRSPTLFLAAGGILLIYALLNGLWAFMELGTGESGLEVGYVLGFLALLGLYPSLAGRAPWLARAGAAASVAGVVGMSVISATELGRIAGAVSGTPPGWSLVLFLTLFGFLLGYLAIGVGTLRTGCRSRRAGLLLLVPGVIVVLMLAHIAAGFASDVTAFVISAGEAMAHLAIGATLRSESADTDSGQPSTEAEVGLASHD